MFISSHAPLQAGYYWRRPTGYATVLIRPVPLRGRAATGSVNRAMQLRILAVPCVGWLPLAPPPRVLPPTRKWGKTRWAATELNLYILYCGGLRAYAAQHSDYSQHGHRCYTYIAYTQRGTC